MSILSEVKAICDAQHIPVMTGEYVPPQGADAPIVYAVLTPIEDELVLHADDLPGAEVQSLRLTLFSRGNYLTVRKAIRDALLCAEFTITDMRYIEFERDTGFHHYAIDVEAVADLEE